MKDKIGQLKAHFKNTYFKIFEGSGLYFWIASGSVRDFLAGEKPKDIDFFFPTPEKRDEASEFLVSKGFKKIQNKFKWELGGEHEKFQGDNIVYDIGVWGGASDPPCLAETPQECIEWFCYTAEMVAIDSNSEFYSYPSAVEDICQKKLVRNPVNRIEDLYPKYNVERLLKYLKNGYTIDDKNLLRWAEDQQNTFEHKEKFYKKVYKINKESRGAYNHLKPHFDIFKSLDLYFWISGGALLSFFTEQKANDIDVYFPTKNMADQAVGLLKKDGFKIKHSWENNRILQKGGLIYDVIHEFNNPNQIFDCYDYTICMAYLDCKGKWKCHDKYFEHINLKKIVRNKEYITNRPKVTKLYTVNEIKRLLKILNKGFSIDSDNLKVFLEDARDIIVSEYEFIEKIKDSD